MKKSTLAAGLKAAAGHPLEAPSAPNKSQTKRETVLIGAHYAPEVRRTLLLVRAETGRTLKQILGEAINDLCAKYKKPQPYTGEE